jgi:hypothetical protein
VFEFQIGLICEFEKRASKARTRKQEAVLPGKAFGPSIQHQHHGSDNNRAEKMIEG